MSETHLVTQFGECDLHRFPTRRRELLRAWDAADEYLLQELSMQELSGAKALIVNDGFGALALGLHHLSPTSWSDSWLAHQALKENLRRNDCDPMSVKPLPSTETPEGTFDLVLIKLPKSLALLEDQLIRLKPLLGKESRVIVAGMVRTMPSSVWKMLEKTIGPTETSLAVKKARLIHVSVDANLPIPENPYPGKWAMEGSGFTITNHSNVFSRDRLDIGTRFLLQHLPVSNGPQNIIDLGCGNGILGLMAASQNPKARVQFVDESYMAIASARENFRQIDDVWQRAEFHLANGLSGVAKNSTDLILCNPPFHQSHAVGDTVALSMFGASAEVLRAKGELWVIGNRHLSYHRKLQRWFNSVDLMASNKKFVILKATL